MALVALGVCGGIGAYKAVEVARGLQQRGHDVAAVLTANAARFVGPLTFEAITRRPVAGDQFAPGVNAQIEHIALASDLQLLLVVPATANILGKFANGIADDFLSALYLATTAPVLVAPAMNTNMLAHPAVAANLDRLAERGVRFVEPGEGYLACGWVGRGRLAEPADVVAAADRMLGAGRSLAGRRVLVTAGPTVEDLDPVRYLGNRSSGRMGYAIAAEALARGAQVDLVAGPTALEPPAGAEVFRVRGAEEMRTAVMARVAGDGDAVDLVVMVAAVADYTPAGGARDAKLLRDRDELVLTLRRTPDILAALGRWRAGRDRPVLVGFAAEVGDPVARAREKLRRKQVDLVVANDVSRPGAGFGGNTNVATLVTDTEAEEIPLGTKRELARVLLDRVEPRLAPLASGSEGAT
ncbi:MAG: bifunctional phosphopantothenoylcysteine decarboxylase/phosphopantothenate--cysteine ligase CoaBC [Acidobacteria bacterium]|nr:bifunctional phosphopantothenoylcysteine decarboxylase/phosphopantothenate--cysteine ligase CoaBC [Acidobacteriota bacterium]